jgi:hypothetical protein
MFAMRKFDTRIHNELQRQEEKVKDIKRIIKNVNQRKQNTMAKKRKDKK